MSYVVERTIEDVEFGEKHVQEIRQSVKEDMLEENPERTSFDEDEVEIRVRERLEEIAVDRTLNEQGDCRLHNDIDHKEVRRQD